MQLHQITHKNNLLNHIHIHHKHLSVKLFPNLGGSVQELVVNDTNIIDGITIDEEGLKDYKSPTSRQYFFLFPIE